LYDAGQLKGHPSLDRITGPGKQVLLATIQEDAEPALANMWQKLLSSSDAKLKINRVRCSSTCRAFI